MTGPAEGTVTGKYYWYPEIFCDTAEEVQAKIQSIIDNNCTMVYEITSDYAGNNVLNAYVAKLSFNVKWDSNYQMYRSNTYVIPTLQLK